MMGINILYPVWSIHLCQYFIRCRIFNYLIPVQDTIHLLSGERMCIAGVCFDEFSLYIPMLIIVRIQNSVRRLYFCMIIVQG